MESIIIPSVLTRPKRKCELRSLGKGLDAPCSCRDFQICRVFQTFMNDDGAQQPRLDYVLREVRGTMMLSLCCGCSGLHSCANKQCKQVVQDCGELIPCRRCPEAYHEKCMPEDLLKVRDGRIWIADKDADGM